MNRFFNPRIMIGAAAATLIAALSPGSNLVTILPPGVADFEFIAPSGKRKQRLAKAARARSRKAPGKRRF